MKIFTNDAFGEEPYEKFIEVFNLEKHVVNCLTRRGLGAVITGSDRAFVSMSILEVPLEADGEVLTIDLDQDLPDDPSEICVLLENENCAPRFWLAFGSAYSRREQPENALEVIQRGLSAPVVAKDPSSMAHFHSFICWLYLKRMRHLPVAEKIDEYGHAVDACNKALQQNPRCLNATLARGAISLGAGQFDDALQPFQSALAATGDQEVYAKIGRARALYAHRNYRGALSWYQKALKQAPSIKPDPRPAIGLCYWRLGDKTRAAISWERSLSLGENEPSHVLLGLYFLDLSFHGCESQADFELTYKAAVAHFEASYRLNPHGRGALGLASFLFSRHDMQKVRKLAEGTLKYATLPQLQAEAHFWFARAVHYDGDIKTALNGYTQAVSLNPHHVPAALAKGMAEISLGSDAEALITLEKLAHAHPHDADAAFYAGIVNAVQSRLPEAVSNLERYLSIVRSMGSNSTLNPDALLWLARLTEGEPEKALEFIREAIKNQSKTSSVVHCNHGVLAYLCDNFDESSAAFRDAQKEDENKQYVPTIAFNLARLTDASGNSKDALDAYEKLLEEYPHYSDASLRSLYLQYQSGESVGDEVQKLIDSDKRNADARAFQSWLFHRVSGEVEQKSLKHTLMEVDKHDVYALVAMGNLYLKAARDVRISKDSDADKRDKSYMRAAEFFEKALQIDSYCAYAAQGIAILFAETKRGDQALELFRRVRETLDNDPGVFVNAGHCCMEVKQYAAAAEHYEQALLRSANTDAGLYSLLGRSWFARGSQAKDIDALLKALHFSKQSLELHSKNPSLRFNVAFVQFHVADVIRRLPCEQRTLLQISEAREGLKEAIETLTALAEEPKPPFPAEDLKTRASIAEESVMEHLESAAVEQSEFERTHEERLEQARQAREKELASYEEQARRTQELSEEKERELAKERKRLYEEAQQWEAERAAEAGADSNEPEKKRARKSRKDDDFIADDSPQPSPPSSPSESVKQSPGHGENGVESEEGAGREKRRNVIDDDDDEDDDNVNELF